MTWIHEHLDQSWDLGFRLEVWVKIDVKHEVKWKVL